MRVGVCAARFLVLLFATQVIQAQTPVLTLPERRALARPLLLHAEEAASSADPDARAFLLYRTAGAWVDLDRARAAELYSKAFAVARGIVSDQVRPAIEYDILSDLLPLAPSTMLELIPQAAHEKQDFLYREAINYALSHKDVARAVKIFDQAAAAGFFFEPTAAGILTVIPESNTADRVHVFNSAMAAYKAQVFKAPTPNAPPSQFKIWNASRLIAYFWQSLPAAQVLAGIDTVLDRAAEMDKLQPIGGASIGNSSKNLSYRKYVDIELFAVAPALKKLDPARANALLAEHPAVEEFLSRFPDGLPSFAAGDLFFRGNGVIPRSQPVVMDTPTYATVEGAQASRLMSLDMGLEFTIPLDLKGLGVLGAMEVWPPSPEATALLGTGKTCPPDVPHILASADAVELIRKPPPCMGTCISEEAFPRADLLNALAERCTYDPHKAAALPTLAALLAILPQIPADRRVKYLANAADLYLRLGERDAAASTVKTGFELAATLLAQDKEPSRLQSLPKAVWPSAEVYRKMISLGVNANFEQMRAAVEAIPDADIRELERVMLARTLLGVPVTRYIVFYANGSSMTGNSGGKYDDVR
jgi:hypothetical protein